MAYNGWTNKETWLVNIWYLDDMVPYLQEMETDHIEGCELEEHVRGIAEECEALSQLPPGLLSDFINDSWAEVNWAELAEHINANLKVAA